MRVTQSMMVTQLLTNLTAATSRMLKLQDELSTGKRISRPSDDPAGTLTALRYRTAQVEIDRYRRNAADAREWMNTTETALRQAVDIVQRARELAVRGASATLPQDARDAIAAEVRELRDELIQVANTAHGDRYVFGGFRTQDKPYDDDPSSPTYGAYRGTPSPGGVMEREVGPGLRLAVNVRGDEAFGDSTAGLIKTLGDLAAHLSSAVPADWALVGSSDLGQLDTALDNLLNLVAELGAKANRLDLTQARLEELDMNLSRLLSETEDVDMAETIVHLTERESVYRAALATGSRIILP
ncbi:MAG: flagellar hook-associated protein FlgL, partial [Clostridia bacterium]|nr:flagellar hook-associated protein FlgL [Clostridia bacterium]